MAVTDLPSPLPCEAWLALHQAIAQADHEAALAALARQGRDWCGNLLSQGAGARLVGRCLAALSDGVTRRAIELARPAFQLPETPWCWLVFGSEGREEQTLATDQDNGIVFAAQDEQEAEYLQSWFLPFARRVNAILDSCGYQYCPGDIMASNPACCLSLGRWQESFQHWLRLPEPDALLKATIYFDLRGVYGDLGLVAGLQDFICAHVPESPAFLHLLTENARGVAPPLGLLGELREEEGALDLKKFGSRLFVDGARILALATGIRVVDTVSRLQLAGPLAGLGQLDVEAAVQGFLHVQGLRFRSQWQALQAGQPPGNRLAVEAMGEMEQAMLKAVLRQVKGLQQHLGHNYGYTH